MFKTSIGVRAITMNMVLDTVQVGELLGDFRNYEKKAKTNKFNIIRREGFHEINYSNKSAEIKWTISFFATQNGVDKYILETKIIPKASLKNDYIIAANQFVVARAMSDYFREAGKINKYCGFFGTPEAYRLVRLDYCVNFYLPELDVKCTAAQMIELLKLGNMPLHNLHNLHNSEHTESGNQKSPPVVIKFSEESKDVIKFELQCKSYKIYEIAKQFVKSDVVVSRDFLWSDEFSKLVIEIFYQQVIRRGDYYTLTKSTEMIEECCLTETQENQLIETLELVSRFGGISKATAELKRAEMLHFYRALRKLSEIGINPVTVPEDWGIEHTPNLLQKCFNFESGDFYLVKGLF